MHPLLRGAGRFHDETELFHGKINVVPSAITIAGMRVPVGIIDDHPPETHRIHVIRAAYPADIQLCGFNTGQAHDVIEMAPVRQAKNPGENHPVTLHNMICHFLDRAPCREPGDRLSNKIVKGPYQHAVNLVRRIEGFTFRAEGPSVFPLQPFPGLGSAQVPHHMILGLYTRGVRESSPGLLSAHHIRSDITCPVRHFLIVNLRMVFIVATGVHNDQFFLPHNFLLVSSSLIRYYIRVRWPE